MLNLFRATWGSSVGQKDQKLLALLKKSQKNRNFSPADEKFFIHEKLFVHEKFDLVTYLLHTTIIAP